MDIQIETFSWWLDMPSEVQSRGPAGETNLGVNRWHREAKRSRIIMEHSV